MLGRGLESLIPPQHQQGDDVAEPQFQKTAAMPTGRQVRNIPHIDGPIFHIEVEKIKPNPHQPRKHFDEAALKELAASISEFGILQPLVVTKIEHATDQGTEVEYQLVAGERRLLASKMIGLPRVPVIVKAFPEEREKLEVAVVENLQRANLSSIETARAYAKLQDHFGLTQREIATRLGKSRETVANSMRLLNLPTYIQEALSKNQLSESQGRLLLAVADSMQQQTLFEDILRNNLSVRELKTRISRMGGKAQGADRGAAAEADPETQAYQQQLEQFFGTKVRLQRRGASGKIEIEFYSPEDLRGILERLAASTAHVDGAPVRDAAAPQDFTV